MTNTQIKLNKQEEEYVRRLINFSEDQQASLYKNDETQYKVFQSLKAKLESSQ
jgi:hypothetical protein